MDAERTSDAAPGRLVVIGNFDGVHRGHRAVLEHAVAEARERELVPTVLTFDPHPAVVLRRLARPPLTELDRKRQLLEQVSTAIEVAVCHFDEQLAALSPEEFAVKILRDRLQARVVVVGDNFRFGHGRSGDLATLADLGRSLGFTARVEEMRGDEQGPFSSTRVRQALAAGDVATAMWILGRPHRLVGRVTRGDGRGRQFGFPTANLRDIPQLQPAPGVYVAEALQGDEWLGRAVVNLGPRPTVERPDAVEVHVLGFSGDLYERLLSVDLLERLREVRRFPDVEELKAQITRDVEAARQADLTSALTAKQDATDR